MEVKSLLDPALNEKEQFTYMVTRKNIHRGKLFSKFIIFIEIIRSLIIIFLSHNNFIKDFKVNNYLAMYSVIIFVNILYLFYLSKVEIKPDNYYCIDFVITIYVIFIMIWGAVISLIDQELYGQILGYITNLIACSAIYYIDNKKLLFSYVVSAFVFFYGLPFFQQSKNIIFYHYINGIIALICSYFASRMLYGSLYNDFKSKILIIEANEKLKKKIKEKTIIQNQLESANKIFKELSIIDELTNVNNRRGLREHIENIFINTLYRQKPVSIIMMDIDDFKLYNDKYGHVKGDEVLKKVSKELNETVRDSKDFVARYGGEEFIYIALETDKDEINEIANIIRRRIYNLKIIHEYSRVSNYVTISLGTATTILHSADSLSDCIENADMALYEAKFAGKNRII